MSRLARGTSVVAAIVISALAVASRSGAQSASNAPLSAAPQADSAQQARAAYRRAVGAFRQRDLTTARQEMRRAAELWPTQQLYLESAAGLAAIARDTGDATRWIGKLADLGVGAGVSRDTTYRGLVGAWPFDAAAARLTAATAPVPRSRVRLTIPDTLFHAEGIAFDAGSGRWLIGSVRQRRIVAVGRDGRHTDFVPSGADGLAGVFGMAVDSARRTLWVATTALPRMEGFMPADSGRVGVFAFDLETGRLSRSAWMPGDSSAAHTFGDVALAPNGDVYVSDSQSPWIHRLPAGGEALVAFVTHPLFRSLQGMAISPDGRTMFVADYSHGLLRIDLRSRAVTALRASPGITLLGIDGLYLHRGALIAVQNGIVPPRLVRFCLDAAATTVVRAEVLDRNPALVDEPTLGTIVGDSAFYVATSQWEKFSDAGELVPGSRLRPATVVGVGLESGSACR